MIWMRGQDCFSNCDNCNWRIDVRLNRLLADAMVDNAALKEIVGKKR